MSEMRHKNIQFSYLPGYSKGLVTVQQYLRVSRSLRVHSNADVFAHSQEHTLELGVNTTGKFI